MSNLLSHPFRLNQNGAMAVRDEHTDEYVSERLAVIISTRPGERPMVPLFGIEDPAFGSLSLPALQVQMELFDIPVIITDVVEEPVSDGTTNVYVDFERIEDEEDDEDE